MCEFQQGTYEFVDRDYLEALLDDSINERLVAAVRREVSMNYVSEQHNAQPTVV